MAKVEEVEEEVKEEGKVLEGDSATGSVRSSGGGGGTEEEDEEHDVDGFETASEGRDGGGSDDEEGYGFQDDEEEKFARLGVKDDDDGITGAQSSGDGVAEGEEKTLREGEGGAGWEAEEQPVVVLTPEQEKEKRQHGIEEAKRAKAEGNSLFGQGQYEEAITEYHLGLVACPPVQPLNKEDQPEGEEDLGLKEIREIRAVLHSNRAACFSYRQMYTEAVEESTKALELNPNYVKALMRRSQAREKLELYEDAMVDLKRVLELDPGNSPAKASLRTLVPLAEEKRERLKNEMLAKLKEAGNSILGRFGMSVDNFKTVQDPSTGSYSIQFQR